MLTMVVYALALAIAWVAIVGSLTLENLVVGFLVGLGITLLRPRAERIEVRRLPGQLFALVLYMFALFRDIVFSGIDVARRVLSPDMRLNPGIIAVSTQDKERSRTILALSANYISLTPGELVVEVADDHIMYVHCLDVEQSAPAIDALQTKRLALLKRVQGSEL